MGGHIAFGHEYAPTTAAGLRLLAHELTHVIQQPAQGSSVLRRKAKHALDGYSTKDLVDDRIAPKIDKALAESSLITSFVPKLQKAEGKLTVDAPGVYKTAFDEYAQKHQGLKGKFESIPGFTDREAKKPIHLRSQGKMTLPGGSHVSVTGATVEHALHELIHLNSHTKFANFFPHNYNEAITEHFTERVLQEQGLGSGAAYRDELPLADELIAVLGSDGEKQVGDAYFQGKADLQEKIRRAFNSPGAPSLIDWRDAATKEPPDWKTANQLLKKALSGGGSKP